MMRVVIRKGRKRPSFIPPNDLVDLTTLNIKYTIRFRNYSTRSHHICDKSPVIDILFGVTIGDKSRKWYGWDIKSNFCGVYVESKAGKPWVEVGLALCDNHGNFYKSGQGKRCLLRNKYSFTLVVNPMELGKIHLFITGNDNNYNVPPEKVGEFDISKYSENNIGHFVPPMLTRRDSKTRIFDFI